MIEGNKTFRLVNKDNALDFFQMVGNKILNFNDETNATFNETYDSVRSTRSASKCYFIEMTRTWYQLIYKDGLVYQYSYNGKLVRRVEVVTRLSDDQIRTLINVNVHSGSGDQEDNPIYVKWENDLFRVLENGDTTVDNIKRIIYNTEKLPNPPYLGGRWLIGFLKSFTRKYPQYVELILDSTLPSVPHNIFD
jgi:hypothetical protein